MHDCRVLQPSLGRERFILLMSRVWRQRIPRELGRTGITVIRGASTAATSVLYYLYATDRFASSTLTSLCAHKLDVRTDVCRSATETLDSKVDTEAQRELRGKSSSFYHVSVGRAIEWTVQMSIQSVVLRNTLATQAHNQSCISFNI